jgi:hypothetical protein
MIVRTVFGMLAGCLSPVYLCCSCCCCFLAQPASLYRGLLSPVAGYGVLFAMSFSAYGQATRYLRSRPQSASLPAQSASSSNRKLSLSEMTLAGAWAGFVQAPARQVIERVKSVMQVRERSTSTSSNGGSSVGRSSKAPYSWSGQCAYQLVKEEGLAMG